MKNYIVYMYPKSSSVTWPTSDTLFGAFSWAYRQLYGKKKLEMWLEDFCKNPRFILSSAFPCLVGENGDVLFFPKPNLLEPGVEKLRKIILRKISEKSVSTGTHEFNQEMGKMVEIKSIWKKVKWVSEKIFQKLIKAEWTIEEIWERKKRGIIPDDIEVLGNLLITTEERKKIIEEKDIENILRDTDVQRNQIDRVTGTTAEGMLFFCRETHFFPRLANLWFLIKTEEPEFLLPLLRYLEDTGIGGERTVGKGHFRLVLNFEKPYEIPQSENGSTFITLSRYIPDKAELKFIINEVSTWNLLNLRPKRDMMFGEGERVWKGIIRCFQEGSIFSLPDRKEYYGQLIRAGIKEPYKIYHNGFTIPAFMKIRGINDES